MTERFRFLQGEFRRLRAASDFLDAQKVTKKALGGGRNRRFGNASRLHAARPLEPPLRGSPLEAGNPFRRAKLGVLGRHSVRPYWGPEWKENWELCSFVSAPKFS